VDHTGHQSKKQIVAVIPARFASTRLPGKALIEIAGRPMILHIVERTLSASHVSRVIVATDDERIEHAVRAAGFEAVMTSPDHTSGSDRLAEVARNLVGVDIIVNVQGDEPLISPLTIDRAVDSLLEDETAMVATTSERITDSKDVLSPNVVKVVVDQNGRAKYFSRSPIPFPRAAVLEHGTIERALDSQPDLLGNFRKHTGLYVYRREFLIEYSSWPQSTLERIECLEQLRILERGFAINVVEVEDESIGVDTPEDLARVRAILEAGIVVG
jgi:3-deoxy-manno-octulosonate cytidylyltransferase (CMP-KDO synthetase)